MSRVRKANLFNRPLRRVRSFPTPSNQLTADERSLLWLREVEGQSYAEMAGILDIPIGTVRSRLFAARRALREIWQSAPQMNGGRS